MRNSKTPADAGSRDPRYPWETSADGLVLAAVAKGMEYRFPYRVVTVRRARGGGADAQHVTLAPTFPPVELSEAGTRHFDTIEQAMSWAEGVYDEALGRA